MDDIFYELLNYIESRPVINTHSHHKEDSFFKEFNLDTLLENSYVDWCGVPLEKTPQGRTNYLNKVKFNSYFVWLQKSLQALHNSDEPLSADNWDTFSSKIENAHKDENYHMNILRQKCRYSKILLDAYWQPGNDNGHPDTFSPVFRINMFLFGYSPYVKDHNGNNPLSIYNNNKVIQDIDEYISFMKEIIMRKKQEGCVALKSALAYDRDLNFTETTKQKAQRALSCNLDTRTNEDIKAFQDYVFFKICEIAAELDLPFQCHTGMGQLKGTNAMLMHEVIEKNPDTKFILFHCSYPWLDDVNGLLHLHRNVYPDLCWLPIISTSAAQRMLYELIEVGTSDKVCWGCDTWTSEESYGALLAVMYVLADVLGSKVKAGYFSLNDARIVADNILYNNAANLYKLSPLCRQ